MFDKTFKYSRPSFTIHSIGRTRFYFSILIGFVVGLILFYGFYLFFYIDSFLSFNNDYRIYDGFIIDRQKDNSTLYALSGLSLCLGYLITVYLWLTSHINHIDRRISRFARYGATQVLFYFFMVLYFVFKMQSVTMEYSQIIVQEYQYSFWLLPVFLFLFANQHLSRIYKNWVQLIFSSISITAACLLLILIVG